MKRRQHPEPMLGMRQWTESEWALVMIDSQIRHNQSVKSRGYSKSVDLRRSRIGLVAEYHFADQCGLPRPNPLTSVANGDVDFIHPTLGRVDVKGHDLGNDQVWVWNGTLGRTDTYACVGVDLVTMFSHWTGVFSPAEALAQGARRGSSLVVSTSVMREDGNLVWQEQDMMASQLTLGGVEAPLEYQCRVCKRWLPSASFHRNRTKKDGIQDECKDCKQAMERERKLDIRGRVT